MSKRGKSFLWNVALVALVLGVVWYLLHQKGYLGL